MKSRVNHISFSALSILTIFILWSVVDSADVVADVFLPGPLEVLVALKDLFVKSNFLRDIGISLARIGVGFIAASIIAIPLGVFVGINKKVEALVEPVVDFIRYTPVAAFIPLLILWFGIGELEKIIVIAVGVFFQLVLMVANSVAHTPHELIELAKTLGAKRGQLITSIVLPYSSPRIVDDLRVSMGWAWASLILAEVIGSTSGVGFVIVQSQRLLQTDNVMAAILVVGILGLITDYVFKTVYKISFPWVRKTTFYAKA